MSRQPRKAISNQQSAISLRYFVSWLLMAGCWLLSSAAAFACPMCKEALLDPGQAAAQAAGAANGYAASIAALLSVPFVLVGGIATLVARSARRHQRSASSG